MQYVDIKYIHGGKGGQDSIQFHYQTLASEYRAWRVPKYQPLKHKDHIVQDVYNLGGPWPPGPTY